MEQVSQRVPSTHSLVDLPNISFVLAEQLARIGITCPDQLRRAGALMAGTRLRDAGLRPIEVHLLLALEGAIEGIPWQSLTPEIRRDLRQRAAMAQPGVTQAGAG